MVNISRSNYYFVIKIVKPLPESRLLGIGICLGRQSDVPVFSQLYATCRVAANTFVSWISRNFQFRIREIFSRISRNTNLKFGRNFRKTRNRNITEIFDILEEKT